MDLLIIFLVSAVLFAVQLKLCRSELGFWTKMIPVVMLAVAAVVTSVIYAVLWWGYSNENYTWTLFLVTMVIVYFAVADGMAWLVNNILNRRDERKQNS